MGSLLLHYITIHTVYLVLQLTSLMNAIKQKSNNSSKNNIRYDFAHDEAELLF